jgi:predicted Fe-S protein YdhL (DUF1289 family)
VSGTVLKIESPCVSQCCLDEGDVCMGCFRHIDEITGWHGMSDVKKLELLALLKGRRKKADDFRRSSWQGGSEEQ